MNESTICLCVGAVNLLTLLIYGLDKLLALGKKRRVPESALLTLAALGSGLGALLAMVLFRHKINPREHPGFVWGVPLIFLTQLALVLWLLTK